jgi:phospholipase/carboxylesterase
MREDERGGALVVLLHGWGARGDDLASVAQALARPQTRFVLPAAPLTEASGGRAWWHLDDQRPARATEGGPPAGHAPSRQLQTVREAIQTLLVTLQQRHAPDSIALVGFSQGAMLALDVALAGTPRVDRVAALSGALLADTLPALQAAGTARPAVFIAHGTSDPVVPFRSAEIARDLLQRHGLSVAFHAFGGGHTIPRAITEPLGRFLTEA